MLRVGLTGGLGSGKSTAARMFAALGAHVLQSDTIGREMMEPGQAVYAAIVDHFGRGVVRPDSRLDRAALAKIAFDDGRVEELNAIVHPAVIARQAREVGVVTHHGKQPLSVGGGFFGVLGQPLAIAPTDHCRAARVGHVRGCWVVDHVLGKG